MIRETLQLIDQVSPPAATVERYDTEAAWLAARRRGLGASEAAAIVGLSPFLSPMDVWAAKVGLAEPTAERERMRWGKRLQRPIAEGYAEETGRTVVDPGPYTLLRSTTYPWLCASPDAFVIASGAPGHGPGMLEIKNVSAWQRDEWDEEPPLGYQVQLQMQMLVSGFTWGSLAALLGGHELRYRDLAASPRVQSMILDALECFWRQYVQAEVPPPVDGSERTTEMLRRLYPRPQAGVVVTLPPDAVEWDATIQAAEAQIRRLDADIREAKNLLRAAIGEAETGVLPGGVVWRHALQRRQGYTVPPWEGRVLVRRTQAQRT
jgi:putative phage-type endonuclease